MGQWYEETEDGVVKVRTCAWSPPGDHPVGCGMYLHIKDGKVVKVILLYNEDLSDEDIVAYYEDLGYKAMPFDGEEEGEVGYLFMNMSTGDMFTYMNGRAEFVDLSNFDDEDWDDED